MALIKITLSGGYHNAKPIKVALAEKLVERLKAGEVSITDFHVLSTAQRNKLDRHFCGIRGCMCGGISRAKIDF